MTPNVMGFRRPTRRVRLASSAAASATSATTAQRQSASEVVAALDHVRLTRGHKVFLLALLTALIFDYLKPYTISFVIPGMRQLWDLSEATASYLAVAGLAGTMLGAAFWGFMADRIGRRKTLLWTVGIFTIGSLCGLMTQFWQTLVACLFMGFGVGGETPIVFALAAEYLPIKVRGRSLLFLGLVGSAAGYALAAAVSTGANAIYPPETAWRAMWLVGLFPAAIVLVFRSKVVPESARYLLARNRVDEAVQAARSFLPGGAGPDGRAHKRVPVRTPLPISGLYGRTVTLGLFSFAWGIANFGFITWLPTLLGKFGFGQTGSSAYLAVSAVFALPALVITTMLMTRWSTRWTLAAYALGGATAMVALGLGASLGFLSPLFLIGITALGLFFITSIGGLFSIYAAEVFPTTMRARRSGMVAAAGKFGGVVGPYFGGVWLAAGGSVLGLQLPLAVALVSAGILLALVGVETRGRSLEQIA